MFNLTIPLVYKRVFFSFLRANFVKMIKINETLWMLEGERRDESSKLKRIMRLMMFEIALGFENCHRLNIRE